MPEREIGKKHPNAEGFKTHVYKPQTIPWWEVFTPIAEIDRLAFEKDRLRWLKLFTIFKDPTGTVAILRSPKEETIGFSVIIPIGEFDKKRTAENRETAYISKTALHPSYQNQGLSNLLLDTVDDHLKKEGYTFVEKHARIKNGYADKLLRRYEGRIVDKGLVDEETDHPMRWLRITL